MSIIASVHDGLAIIEIARPVKKNALTLDMYDAMADALVAAQADASVYALVMTGQPGVFTAGNDLEDFLTRPPGEGAELEQWPVLRFMRALLFFGKPIVAAVTGVAVGVGTTMLLHCDLVYLSEDARLFMPFVKLGLVPEFASSAILPQLLGRVRTAEKVLLGEPLTAAEAVEFGLANAALPAAEVLDHAIRIARRFKTLPPGAVRDTRKLLRHGASPEALFETVRLEIEVLGRRLHHAEAKEACRAFLEKREADFSQSARVAPSR